MNQQLVDFSAIIPAVVATGIASALCTILRRNGTYNTDGQPDLSNTGYSPLAGHVNLVCMSAPLDAGAIHATEKKTDQDILETTNQHIWLAGYYPAIRQADLAQVNGQNYNILGVEVDSQHITTRLGVEVAVL